ncbi:hypothetical protein C2E25_02075 [Geothermobacter hydrogeniphilus]|uniref:Uncharacterized protein n=1 Tax=Geothermobacter hydrogeniphilus TaxID=1969733 RepID=A0A2K2HDJ0_9BACT|nr:hypothetical protein [Geothermobacter hydrogeniphilus]PNU21365.1 hypothetical protein C2E25_02075 [Geothermobacter hydrogeniphilus]
MKEKKHPCPDCRMCQWCSDDRCRLCLKSGTGCRKKLSVAEQIALFEAVNRKSDPQKEVD